MAYQKWCYWVDHEDLGKVRKSSKEKGIELKVESQIPCRALRTSWEVAYLTTPAWYGLCRRRTSWYWESEKAGRLLVVSNTSLDPLNVGNPILVTESSFKPDRLPSPKEITPLIRSEKYQERKPSVWENIEPVEKEFYQTWFERHRANEPFDFNIIFASHSANHSNFIDPKYFVAQNGFISPYSIAVSSYVCSCCLEFFNILGERWPIKYVVPCIGAILFAHLPMDQYFEVRDQRGENVNKNIG